MTWVMPVIRPGDYEDEVPAINRTAMVFVSQDRDVPLTALHMEQVEGNSLRQFARPRRVARRL